MIVSLLHLSECVMLYLVNTLPSQAYCIQTVTLVKKCKISKDLIQQYLVGYGPKVKII